MNVRVERLAAPNGFEEFCDRHGIELVAHERSKRSGLPRWYAAPRNLVEIRERGTLTSVHGSGETPEEAIRNYAALIAGHRLLIGGLDGIEVVAPNEWEPDEVAAVREP